uniref:Xylulose kinase-1 n=1 Tax=Tanacetum cinerariifolium TaxID=118510 RepID=A0A699HL12_TANCI|nr:hypothetical protein [Tanacetum cinerariifolium]
MALTFADTHNMIAFLTKSNASEGFEQIIDFLNTNDVVRLQALIDKRKVIITEDTVRQALRLDDAKSIDCLPNEEIFAELAMMGYEKPSTKLTFYKAFFSAQWNLVRNANSSSKFYMYLKFQQIMINAQVGMLVPQQVQVDIDVAIEDEDAVEPTLPTPATTSPPQEELIPLTLQQQHSQPSQPSQTTAIFMDLLNTLLETYTTLTRKVENLEQDKIAQALEITKLKQRVRRLEKKRKLKVLGFKRLRKGRLEESQAQVYHLDLEHAQKVLSMQDDKAEPVELTEVIEVVTTTKLMTEVVTAAATIITAAPMHAASAARRRKGVVIRDPEEIATLSVIVHFEPKSKDKGKGILVEEPKPLKKQAQIEHDEAYARELKAELNANINWNDVIERVKRKRRGVRRRGKQGNQEKNETSEEEADKKQKLDEEVEDLKTNLQIVPNDEDDVYTEATPLALKPNVEAHIWKNQIGSYGLAKVKSWKLLESCRVHIITFITIQMILLVEKSFGVDSVEDFNGYMLRDYYYWLKTYCCWYKLKLLDNAADTS